MRKAYSKNPFLVKNVIDCRYKRAMRCPFTSSWAARISKHNYSIQTHPLPPIWQPSPNYPAHAERPWSVYPCLCSDNLVNKERRADWLTENHCYQATTVTRSKWNLFFAGIPVSSLSPTSSTHSSDAEKPPTLIDATSEDAQVKEETPETPESN